MNMISSKIVLLELKNYKLFDDLKIEFEKYNVFVGPNSSGKSSIAEFFIFFRELIKFFGKKEINNTYVKDFLENAISIGQKGPLFIKIKIIIGGYLYDYEASISREPKSNILWANDTFIILDLEKSEVFFKGSLETKVNYPNIKGNIRFKGLGLGDSQTQFQNDGSYLSRSILKFLCDKNNGENIHFHLFERFYNYWEKIRFYDSNRYIKKEIVEFNEISNDLILSEDFKNLISVLLNINLQQKEIFEDIGNWLKRLIENFKELRLKMSDIRGSGEILFSEKGWPKSILFPIKWASDGIIRLLCYLTILFNEQRPPLIMLDEPENGFHPTIRTFIVDFSITSSDNTQIIYITHDSESLRSFKIENIFYFKRKGLYTRVIRLSDEKSLVETINDLKDVEKNTIVSTHRSNSL